MTLIPDKIHPSWCDFLDDKVKSELKFIEGKIGTNFNPTRTDLILRFLTINLNHVKVIWLGQDVYPARGVATGRAFEVGNINSWSDRFNQNSLQNIIRLIYKNYNDIENYDDILKFTEIRREIKSGRFPIKPPKQWFNSLENQGVLFLNCSFTCEIGQADSHRHIWESFSKKVLNYISNQNLEIKWFLWGRQAIEKKKYIPKGVFLESRHPSRCSSKFQDDFLKFEGFKDTCDIINWLG